MSSLRAPLALLAAALFLACTRPPAEETAASAPPQAIAHEALGLRLASLPAGWTVTSGDGARWGFSAPLGEAAGTATIEIATPVSPAVNLVEEAKAYGEAAAAAESGEFFGGNELVTPYGSAYTVRVLAERGTVEERAVFLLHPDGSGRLLRIGLRHAPSEGETARDRLKQALELVGALEPLAAAP